MNYEKAAELNFEIARAKELPIILAIESSCDETAASVIRGGREVLSMSVYTQIPLHKKYGGVVPELASRSHVEKIGTVVEAALNEANLSLDGIDAIAVTSGPGLVGALLVGVSYAKGLALATNKPLIAVNHLAGHIAANYLSHSELKPPFICLVASGGHSHIINVNDYNSFTLLGKTRDDAAGEAFDKIARVLGLSYPGGPELEKLAQGGNKDAFAFRAPFNEGDSLDFSFSGIKTAVINLCHNSKERQEELNYADVAASFQRAVVNTLTEKTLHAARLTGSKRIALAGGVSANKTLRAHMQERFNEQGFEFFCPDMRFCTDNAAMIGCAAYYSLKDGMRAPLSLNACANLKLV